MKKMFKRTAAMAISAFMAAQYIPFSAVATDQDKSKLTIHPYYVDGSDYATLSDGTHNPTGFETDDTKKPASSSAASITFTLYEVNADKSLKTTGAHNYTTAGTVFDNVVDGYYKVVPSNANTDDNFADSEAFYIQLPASSRDVHIYPKFTNNNDTDPANPGEPEVPAAGDVHNITLYKTDSNNSNIKLKGAEYQVYYKNSLGNWVAAANTYTTDANGKICITGLPIGKYYFVEKTAPNTTAGNAKNYLLDQEPIAFEINGTSKPADLNVTNDSELTVSKVISKDGQGANYNWTITAEIPEDYKNLVSYKIKDEYDSNIVLNRTHPTDSTAADADANAVIVKQGDTELTRGTHYTAAITDASGGNRANIIVMLTPVGLNALTSGTDLTVTVRSLADANYLSGTEISNKASIDYQYAYDPGKDPELDGDDTVPDDPDKDDIIAAGPIPDPDPADPDPTKPNNPPINSYPSATDPDVEAKFTPATITISNVSSDDTATPKTELAGASYEITGCSVHADGTGDVVVLNNLAPGLYTITQKSVDSGHKINDTAKNIYIDTDGKVYEGNNNTGSLLGDVNATVVFVNDPVTAGFNLPFTGTTATIVFSVTGLIIMAGTLFFFFVILKKRDDDDEEEQENN